MNDKNRELLLNDDSDMTAVITLTDEDGNDVDTEVIASIEVEELGKEFIAVLPQQTPEGVEELEAMILEYSEDENGDPVFSPIEDDEEFELVSSAFNQFFAGEIDEEEEEGGFLDDIGEILPGVSIQKD
jgi:uncharacterized protein YrzB (UPF0473 family)